MEACRQHASRLLLVIDKPGVQLRRDCDRREKPARQGALTKLNKNAVYPQPRRLHVFDQHVGISHAEGCAVHLQGGPSTMHLHTWWLGKIHESSHGIVSGQLQICMHSNWLDKVHQNIYSAFTAISTQSKCATYNAGKDGDSERKTPQSTHKR